MGTCMKGGGIMSYTTFGTWEREDEGDKILKCSIRLTYLRSELIFIKQYSDSMCFSSIFWLKITNHTFIYVL